MTEIVKASSENEVQKSVLQKKGYHPAHIQLQKGILLKLPFIVTPNCYKENSFEHSYDFRTNCSRRRKSHSFYLKTWVSMNYVA